MNSRMEWAVGAAFGCAAVACLWMFIVTARRDEARTADYCRAIGMAGYESGIKFVGSLCIDHEGNYVGIPRGALK